MTFNWLCGPGWPWTRNLSTSPSRVLELGMCHHVQLVLALCLAWSDCRPAFGLLGLAMSACLQQPCLSSKQAADHQMSSLAPPTVPCYQKQGLRHAWPQRLSKSQNSAKIKEVQRWLEAAQRSWNPDRHPSAVSAYHPIILRETTILLKSRGQWGWPNSCVPDGSRDPVLASQSIWIEWLGQTWTLGPVGQ
jgi:hypothetical protein